MAFIHPFHVWPCTDGRPLTTLLQRPLLVLWLFSYFMLRWQDSLLPMPWVLVIVPSSSHAQISFSLYAQPLLLCRYVSHPSPTPNPVSHLPPFLIPKPTTHSVLKSFWPCFSWYFPPSFLQLYQFSLISSWHNNGELLITGPTLSPIAGIIPQAQILICCFRNPLCINCYFWDKVQDNWSSFSLVAPSALFSKFLSMIHSLS